METATKKKKKPINLNRNYNSQAKICKPKFGGSKLKNP